MPVPMKIACPHCGDNIPYESDLAGKSMNCGNCGQRFKMPAAPEVEALPLQEPIESDPTENDLGAPAPVNVDATLDWSDAERPSPRRRSSHSPSPAPVNFDTFGDRDFAAPSRYHKSGSVADSESQWHTVQSGLRLIQVGYVTTSVSFLISILLTGPMFTLTWPGYGSSGRPEMIMVMDRSLVLGLALGGLYIGLFLILLGKGMCCMTPSTWLPFVIGASMLLLLAGGFCQLLQASLPAAWRAGGMSSNADVPLFLLRVSGLVASCLSQFLLVLFALQLARAFRDRAARRLAVTNAVLFPIYYLISIFLAVLLLLSQMNLGMGGSFRVLEQSGVFVTVVALSWASLGICVMLALLVLLQQLRSTIQLALFKSSPT